MAKRQEKRYVFTPGVANTGTVKIPGKFSLEDILLITNVTDNIIIFNFADSARRATLSYSTTSTDFPYSIDGETTLTLSWDTNAMSSSDKLQIYLEDGERGLTVRPYDNGIDAVERWRISAPQSLVDADFEYGLQNTKWQQLGLNRNYPSFYESPGADLVVTAISGDGASPYSTVTVTVTAGTAPAVGTPISIAGTTDQEAEGIYLVLTNNTPTLSSFTYIAKGVVTNGSIFTPYSVIRLGGIYAGAALPLTSITSDGASNNSLLTVVTSSPHGLVPGSPITISDSTAGTQAHEGSFFVTGVTNGTTFTVDTDKTITAGAITLTNVSLFARNESSFLHRPFDGGVLIGTNLPIYGLEAKRQSKRYFRYQSGKGIWFSTGALFNPIFDIQSATYSNPDITITTQIPHGLQVGAVVKVYGITSTNYNGDYTVKSITSSTAFTVAAASAPSDATAVLAAQPRIAVKNWSGASIRSGIFDDTNGLFWEFDGQKIFAVRRSSTFQLAGTVSVTSGSHTVTGTGTRFQDQLVVGNRITVRGQSYVVTTITDQTTLSISPEYRGTTNSGIKPTIVRELRIAQEDFNYDSLDGNGPSGYTIDTTKMQMVQISYAWYGAGTADFLIRAANGEFVLAHRFPNNNVNDEAYMRSGNLPARYEVSNESAVDSLASASGTSGNITLKDASRFPTASASYPGLVMITSNQSGTIFHELVSYTGKSGNSLTGTTRATTYTQYLAGSSRTFQGTASAQNHPANSSVILMNTTCAPTISHWGSAIVMDGEFDEDRGYLFNITRFTVTVASSTTNTVLLFRPAPSISNTISGALGDREVLNRSQILLKEISFQSDRKCEVAGVLNATNIGNPTWISASSQTVGAATNVYQPSFAQYNTTFTTAPIGGELLFRFLCPASSSTNGVIQVQDLSLIKEINNSVIGGDGTYPDGPEVLAIVVANQSNQSATVDFAIKWTEAQA